MIILGEDEHTSQLYIFFFIDTLKEGIEGGDVSRTLDNIHSS